MADIQDEILREVRNLGKTCAVIEDRTERIQEQVTSLNGQTRGNTTDIARLTAETASQEKDLDELKSTARGAGGMAGAASGGAVWALATVVKNFLWPSG